METQSTTPEVGRFRVLRTLKEGGGVTTLLAEDREQACAQVVLKTTPLNHLSSSTRLRLEHEAEVLRSTGRSAPELTVSPLDNVFCLAVPFVPGESLEDRLKRGPLPVQATLQLALDILEQLDDVHQHGVLHRDVKPANIILDEQGHALLIDFGLSRSARLDRSVRHQPVGTALYVSPEQAGLLNASVDERSDLYSLGVVLFECLSGKPPFRGDRVGEVLRQHLSEVPPNLRLLVPTVPRAVDDLLHRVLRKDPRDRYQSAEAMQGDTADILAALRQGFEPILVPGRRDQRRTLTEPAFIGRVEEQARLQQLVLQASTGQGGVLRLEAESGSGKTRLLDELAPSLMATTWVLRGHGLDQSAQRPFQLLSGPVAALLAADPDVAGRLRQALGEHTAAVCAALPELCGMLTPEVDEAAALTPLPDDARDPDGEASQPDASPAATLPGDRSPLPEAFGETRTLQALSVLLDALGTASRPATLILDDCQWADDLTLRLLRYWQRRRDAPSGCYVLVLLAFRSEEVPARHILRSIDSLARLELQPMTRLDVQRLVESMAGPVPLEVVDLVARLAEGSPFMASAVLRGLVESGALVRDEGAWRLESTTPGQLQSSRQAAVFLARRLDLLPVDSRHLLSVGAVLGKSFDLGVAAHLADQSPRAAMLALDEARRRHIVWLRDEGTQGAFVHDKLRESLLASLATETRGALHARAGEYYRKMAPDRVFELAYHFDAAGQSSRALDYALAAALEARKRYSLSIAETQYRIAARGAADADRVAQGRIAEGLGEVLMLQGRYDEAQAAFQEAIQAVDDPLGRARLASQVGELAFKRGDVKAAAEHLEGALRLLGRRVPSTPSGWWAGCLWEAVVQGLHTLLPQWRLHPGAGQAAMDSMVMRIYSRLAYAYWFGRGLVPCTLAHLREMNLAERYPPGAELAQAYSEHAPVMTQLGAFGRGIRYVEKSLAIRRSLGDAWGCGQSLNFYGVVLYASARFEECLEKCREAVRILEHTGDQWEVNTARWHIALCLYRTGELDGAIAEARHVYETATEIGDQQAAGIALGVWSRASGGEVPGHLLDKAGKGTLDDVHTMAEVSMARALSLMREGSPEAAVAVLTQADATVVRKGLRQEYVAPLLPWLLTALRCQREQLPAWNEALRSRLLSQSRQVLKRALSLSRTYQSNLPHTLREQAWIEASLGRPAQAWNCLLHSRMVAERQGARAEARATRQAQDTLRLVYEGLPPEPATPTEVRSAPVLSTPSTAPAPPTLALADRFEAVLEVGRSIVMSLSPEAVYESVRDAALRLLWAQHCHVFVCPADGALEWRPGPTTQRVGGSDPGTEAPPSRDMLKRALDTGLVTSFVEGQEPSTESLTLSGVRSALCAPILLRGHPVGGFYVTHRDVGGLFNEEEERLASFIATLAGAALENAEGFSALRQMNETLETRVAQRTADLEQRSLDLERQIEERKQIEEALRTAKASAEAANLAKTYFLANVSHEIRTPMNGIVGFTDLALDTQLTEVQREFLTTVKSCATSLLGVVDDIIDLSRIEAGRLELAPAEFDIRTVVQSLVRRLSLKARSKSLELTACVQDEVPTLVVGDSLRVTQILTNLVGNAIKFTDRGSVYVDIGLGDPAPGGIVLHGQVRDTGIGIPKDKQVVIFDAFVQVDTSMARSYGGVGLGLAIASQLAALMDGRIWVESDPGMGSTFHFSLQFGRPAVEPGVPELVDTSTPVYRPLRVLLAEDDPVSRNYVVRALELEGHSVTAVADGLQAVQAVEREPYDALLLDMNLPVLDGFEATRQIRARGFCLPILAVTAAAMSGDHDRCIEAGMDAYLPKPVSKRALIAALQKATQT